MKELEIKLNNLLRESGGYEEIIRAIQNEESVAPFNTVNRLMAYLLAME